MAPATKYALDELIDIPKLQALLDTLDEIHSLPSAIIDTAGKIHTATAWQDICTKFHRANPESEKKCKESDAYIAGQLDKKVAQAVYKCPFGLVDTATPVIVEGQHLCNVFTGQLFTEKPDENTFIRQAREYGFDEKDYLEALRKVPVISEERLRKNLKFLGEFAGMLAAQGLTHKRQLETEMALRESEARFRSMFEDHGSIMLLIEPESGNIVDANAAAVRFYGHSIDRLKAMRIDQINALSPAEVAAERELAVKMKRSCFIFPHRLASGEVRTVEVRSCPVKVLGQVLLFSIVSDITEREQIENALTSSLSLLTAALESTADGILVVDTNGHIARWNQKFVDLWHVPKELLNTEVKDPVLEYVVAQMAEPKAFLDKVMELYQCPDASSIDVLNLADGRVFRRYSQPQRIGDEIVGRVWSFDDITKEREAEAARVSLEGQLRESQKMEAIGTLAGGIAHDFNNIIANILGNVRLASQDVSANVPALESLEEIRKAASRGRDLVQQILSFSRRQPAKRSLTALSPIVEESARLLRATLPARLRLDVHCDTGIPAVLADTTQIQQVLINLATNAMQAIRGRPGHIDIRLDTVLLDAVWVKAHPSLSALHAKRPGRTVRLAVSDDGPGMDTATLRRIFEPFFTTKPKGEGTGLGLSVVHGIVAGHEGAIEVESQTGTGTKFTLYLPIADVQVIAPDPDQSDVLSVANPLSSSGQHILYIDDDESLVFLVRRLLERRGFRVSGHSDPQDALDTLSADSAQFDLVVTDYNMPGMSGLDVARAVRKIRASLPVVVTSGYIDDELRAQSGEANVLELVFKASTAEDLCDAFARLAQTVWEKSKSS